MVTMEKISIDKDNKPILSSVDPEYMDKNFSMSPGLVYIRKAILGECRS